VVGFDLNGDGWFPFYMRNLSLFLPRRFSPLSLSFSFCLFLTLSVFFFFFLIWRFSLGWVCAVLCRVFNCSVSDNLQNVRGILGGFVKCLRGPCGILFFSGYVIGYQTKLTNLPSPNFLLFCLSYLNKFTFSLFFCKNLFILH
jgi:hypothetical protein